MKRNRKMVALVATLVAVLVVLPATASVVAIIAQARWKAAHPEQTMVPNLTGRDRADAEAAVHNAQLRPVVTFTAIKDKCWQDQPTSNTVVDQNPLPITPVAINTEVRLVIALEEPKTAARLEKQCCGQSP